MRHRRKGGWRQWRGLLGRAWYGRLRAQLFCERRISCLRHDVRGPRTNAPNFRPMPLQEMAICMVAECELWSRQGEGGFGIHVARSPTLHLPDFELLLCRAVDCERCAAMLCRRRWCSRGAARQLQS
eukprot:6554233-Pyramimonas_sp.AAC.1